VALARSLLPKGADFTAAMAFEIREGLRAADRPAGGGRVVRVLHRQYAAGSGAVERRHPHAAHDGRHAHEHDAAGHDHAHARQAGTRQAGTRQAGTREHGPGEEKHR